MVTSPQPWNMWENFAHSRGGLIGRNGMRLVRALSPDLG